MIAGAVVGAVGIEALRHVHRRRDLPLGALPLLLGVHQLTEAFVWWAASGRVAPSTGRAAVWLYVGFAYVVLPLLVPLAVLAVEPDGRRRRVVAWFAVIGGMVALVYLQGMLDGPVSADVDERRIAYRTGVPNGGMIAAVYMVGTLGALLSSSHRRIVTFGAANLVALPVLVLISTRALASLWCAWAAVASVVIVKYLRDASPSRGEAPAPRDPLTV